MTNRQLNKKLKVRVLKPKDREEYCIKNAEVRVLRVTPPSRKQWTPEYDVVIRIKAQVQSKGGVWFDLHTYGPRAIRNFLRRGNVGILQEVESWLKLWGINGRKNINLKTIELVRHDEKI
tara:strand:+ start:135 stop:494 length:360 start_codon:yes stop_codon:yes gene_type:complete